MESLKLISTDYKELRKFYKPIKKSLVEEAITFKRGLNKENKEYTSLYTFGEYEVKVGKPGKEFDILKKDKKGGKTPNENDMTPTTFFRNEIIQRDGRFEEVFKGFGKLYPNFESLRLLGALLVRNALVLDHKNDNGNWRYTPPVDALSEINKNWPSSFGEPLEVFLYYLESIALNEDVKYKTLGHPIDKVGRHNTLMTCANVINIVLHFENLNQSEIIEEIMGVFGRLASSKRGVDALDLSSAIEVFPDLKP